MFTLKTESFSDVRHIVFPHSFKWLLESVVKFSYSLHCHNFLSVENPNSCSLIAYDVSPVDTCQKTLPNKLVT